MCQLRSTILVLVVFLLVLIAGVPTRAQHTITTVAGGGPHNLPALSSNIAEPCDVSRDGAGNFYIAACFSARVFKVDTAGNLTSVAGNGFGGYSGDGGPATSAQLGVPGGIFVDLSGNIFIADTANNRIREVVAATGMIKTIAGNGTQSYGGDGGPAISAELNLSFSFTQHGGVFVDSASNLFIADAGNNRIREVVAATGTIQTIAGNGTLGYAGDGGPATSAELGGPGGIFVDLSGNIFIADTANNRIREVVAATGMIKTIAGNGVAGYSGDGGPATSAELDRPSDVFADNLGNIFIADTYNNSIREVVAATGTIKTIAGNGIGGYSGDGGLASSTELGNPNGLSVDGMGNILIADSSNNRIREVLATTGIIQTVAGNGTVGYSGDGGPAINAALYVPSGVSVDLAGNIFIADTGNNRVREVLASTGAIQTIVGNGTVGYSGDGGPATSAELSNPNDVFLDGAANLFISDTGNSRIREVLAATGTIQTVAGNGTPGYSGDGGPATNAELNLGGSLGNFTGGICVDRAGNVFIADTENNRIREVVAATGMIQTVAGNGGLGHLGDGGPATSAEIENPTGVFVDTAGNIFIATVEFTGPFPIAMQTDARIREVVAATGIIQTVAGNGTPGYSGDGGPSTSAKLTNPNDVFVDGAANLFIADSGNNRIRGVAAATGIIQTVVGTGVYGYFGDGGPASAAELAAPSGLAGNSSGDLLIADSGSQRIRSVSGLITANFAFSLSPQSLSFGNQLVGTSSNAMNATLTNTGSAALTISSISVTGTNSGDFSQTNTCPASNSSLAVAANCTISVTFSPAATGNSSAAVTIRDADGMKSVPLTGIGTDFSLAAAAGGNCPSGGNCSTTAIISAGQTATYNLQVSQLSGFNGIVALTCSGAPGTSTCSVSPASVPPSGSSNYAFTVTVSNTANVLVVPKPEFPLIPMLPALRIALPLVLALSLILSWGEIFMKRTWKTVLPASAVLLVAVIMSSGCAGGGGTVGNTQPPTNATLTITGTSGSVKHQLSVSLTINH